MLFRKISGYLATTLLGLFLFCSGAMAQKLPQFTDLAEQAGDAVVNIYTLKTVEQPNMKQFFQGMPQKDHPFGDFFDQFRKFFGDKFQGSRKQRSLGSGFILSKEGLIVTNHHVVKDADKIKVKFRLEGEEKSYAAEVIGTDPETDLALIRIDADIDLPVLEFGDSKEMDVGQWAVAIGNPFGLDNTVTAGIISAKGRVIGAGPYDNFIQTDASINPGNSGGPLLNMQGEVIGINTAIVSSGQGIGFAIPSNLAKNVISQLKKYKEVRRGWLGVTIQDLDKETAKALGFDRSTGALIASVRPGDPADKAGIKEGDIIVAVNGKSVEDASDLTRMIGKMHPDQKVRLTLWREGKVLDEELQLGKRSTQAAAKEEKEPKAEDSTLGLALRPLKPEESRATDTPPDVGVLVTAVKRGSPAASNGIKPGDIILQANGKTVKAVEEFWKIFEQDAKNKGVLLLLIKREGRNFFKTIKLEGNK